MHNFKYFVRRSKGANINIKQLSHLVVSENQAKISVSQKTWFSKPDLTMQF